VPAESSSWTTVSGLRAQSLKAWNSGALLRELLEPSGAYPRRRALKRPTAASLLSEYAAAQRWAAELFAGAGPYTLETVEVGRRTVGSNRIPAAAVFASVEDEIGFVGKSREAARFRELAAGLGELDPLLPSWAARRPLKLLELGDDVLPPRGWRCGFGTIPRRDLRPAAGTARRAHEVHRAAPAGY
jgi:hypothetical protein